MLPVSRRRLQAQSGHRKTVWMTSQKATWKKKTAWWTRRNWTPLARNTGISGQSWAPLSRRWINVRHNAPVSGFPQARSGIPQGVYRKRFSLGWKSLLCDVYVDLSCVLFFSPMNLLPKFPRSLVRPCSYARFPSPFTRCWGKWVTTAG